MERYSSNLTLFYVIFLPVFSWVFLLAWTLAAFLGPEMNDEVYISDYVKYFFLTLLILATLFILLFSIKLKRLEADEEKIYLSNYFKTTMMPLENIRMVTITDLLLARIVKIQFVNKSRWGMHVKVLERENMFQKYCEDHNLPLNFSFGRRKTKSSNS